LNIYVDESGYTGEDLWNVQQRVFVVASTNLNDDEAALVRSTCFGNVAMPVLKHSRLVKTPRGRAAVIHFVKHAREHLRERFASYVVHKRFALTSFLVDLWVEPSMRRLGYDLYERGGNIAMSNVSYLCLRSLLGSEFEDVLLRFQQMMLMRTRESFHACWEAMQRSHDDGSESVRQLLGPFLCAAAHLGFAHLAQLPQRSLNPAFSVALETVRHWHSRSATSLEVFHDRSTNMARDRWAWDALVGPAVPRTIVGRDSRTIEFPLNVSRTEFVPASSAVQIQLADVLAGATAALAAARAPEAEETDYTRALGEAEVYGLAIGALWPTRDVTPSALGTDGTGVASGGDLLDFVEGLLAEASQRRG
jgi:hypothetical protein